MAFNDSPMILAKQPISFKCFLTLESKLLILFTKSQEKRIAVDAEIHPFIQLKRFSLASLLFWVLAFIDHHIMTALRLRAEAYSLRFGRKWVWWTRPRVLFFDSWLLCHFDPNVSHYVVQGVSIGGAASPKNLYLMLQFLVILLTRDDDAYLSQSVALKSSAAITKNSLCWPMYNISQNDWWHVSFFGQHEIMMTVVMLILRVKVC